MEDDTRADHLEEEEEFVLIELDSIAHIHVPTNAPYVLSDAAPVVHEETGLSEANLFPGRGIVDPQTPAKQVNPVASLHKVLKFRLFSEAAIEDAIENQDNKPPS